MRIPFGRTSAVILVASSISLALEPPKQPEGAASATPAVQAKPDGAANPANPSVPARVPGNGSDTSAALDYLMNRKPQDGSVGKQALDSRKRGESKAIADEAVGNRRNEDQQMRSQFERYLGTAPVPHEMLEEYFAKMKQVSALLRDKQVFAAWKQLHDLGDYTMIDAGMAICVLANGLEEMKRELRKEEMTGDYAGLFSFANKHKLAILAWGSRGLWDPGRNYDDLSKEKAKEIDDSFDIVSNAWARGVRELGEKYGIPQKNSLLWGNCGSAQFAARLCLRKPEYFLAVHVHMPGSYDKPNPEAAKVLWCLTIGELEGGYERSKRWVKAVREMGYPICLIGYSRSWTCWASRCSGPWI
jgi:hypothetical protein